MTQSTSSISSYFFELSEPIFSIQEGDPILLKAGRLVTGALINTVITATSLFETIICASLTIALAPAFLLSKTSGLPKFFGSQTMASIYTAAKAAGAIFGHKAEKAERLDANRVSIDTEVSSMQKMLTRAQNFFSSVSNSLSNVNPLYVLVPAAICCTLLLGYVVYQSYPLLPVADILPNTTVISTPNTVTGAVDCSSDTIAKMLSKPLPFFKQNPYPYAAVIPTTNTVTVAVDCSSETIIKMLSNHSLQIIKKKPFSILKYYNEFCNSACSLLSPESCSFEEVIHRTFLVSRELCAFTNQSLECVYPISFPMPPPMSSLWWKEPLN